MTSLVRPRRSAFRESRGLKIVLAIALALAFIGIASAQAPPARTAYLDAGKSIDARVEDLLARLTLEEKVGLVHANGKFRAGGVPRLGVPPLWTADGPQGVREELGIDSWSPAGWTNDFATAMPVGIALAATWNQELAEAYGRTVGDEARARGKHVILGPGLNIQRTPLGGRSYDYYGEDPWLAGRITVGYVRGMQAEQTVACIKHFAANNQETDRGTIDVQVDERPLREIYLPAFEAGVREGGALAVMGAYNKVRGEYIKTIAVIGDNATRRFAAGGFSAGVKAFHEITAIEGILARVGGRADVVYSQGYRQPEGRQDGPRDLTGVGTSELTAASPEEAKALGDRAIEAARRADAVIFVGGLSHRAGGDDEGVDRRDLSLPAHQDQLIARVLAANPRTVVVLIGGSPVDMMGWLGQAPAVMQAWYGGSEAGHALASVLFGDVSPSGKLPCTFPKKLSDSPAHASGRARQYPGEGGKVWYDEGLLVGYRWNDAKRIEPLFPFGHGLSYTRFRYAGLETKIASGSDGPNATLSLQISNAGERPGAEVVQVYVRPLKPPVSRPDKELKAFAKVALAPGETRTVTLSLGPRAFAYYDADAKGWRAAKGRYEILVGASSRDIRLTGSVDVASSTLLK